MSSAPFKSRTWYVLLFGVLTVALIAFAFNTMYSEENLCNMSYNRGVYVDINITSPSSLVSQRYTTKLYREGGVSRRYDGPDSLGGTPVLFIPGNAGSYAQGRSFGALIANMEKDVGIKTGVDYFVLDFHGDFSAFHGKTLLDEAEYVNDAIKGILNLYRNSRDRSYSVPSSVILISHSLGGIVARTILSLDSYTQGSVNTIFTLSTPHTTPPITFDRDVANVYTLINAYWRTSFSNNTLENPLKDLALVSISGGHQDKMVPPEYTNVDSIVPSTHGISAFSYGIPNVWIGTDHLAIVWCFELRQVLVQSIFAILDENAEQRTLPRAKRIEVLKNIYHSRYHHLNDSQRMAWVENPAHNMPAGNSATISSPLGHLALLPEKSQHQGATFNLHQDTVNTSLLHLVFGGYTQELKHRYTDLRLKNIRSSLISVLVDVEDECENAHNEPTSIRAWADSGESRWYNSSSARVFWYSSSPFVPFLRTQDPSLHLHILTPSLCDSATKVHVRIDILGTLANIVVRYRTLAGVFPLGIILICALIQLLSILFNGQHISFSQAQDLLISKYLPQLLTAAVGTHMLLCSETIREFIRRLQLDSNGRDLEAIHGFNNGEWDIHDVFLGLNDPSLFVFPLIILLISIAFTIMLRLLVVSIIYLKNKASFRTPDTEGYKNKCFFIPSPLSLFSLISTVCLLYLVPYQVALLFLTVLQLAVTTSTESLQFTWTLIQVGVTIADAPTLVVWLHNLSLHWALVFASPSNCISCAGFLLIMYYLRHNQNLAVSAETNMVSKTLAVVFMVYCILYCFLFGAMHSYMMHPVINYLAACGGLLFAFNSRYSAKVLRNSKES